MQQQHESHPLASDFQNKFFWQGTLKTALERMARTGIEVCAPVSFWMPSAVVLRWLAADCVLEKYVLAGVRERCAEERRDGTGSV